MGLNSSLNDVGNCEKTIAFVKKGVLNLAYIQGLSFEKVIASKTRTGTTKPSKAGSGNKF